MLARTAAKLGLASMLCATPFLALASPARAGDLFLSMSPMACQPRAADRGKIDIDYNKGIFNNSSSASAKVFCPIEYTDPNSRINDTFRRAAILAIRNNSSVDFNSWVVLSNRFSPDVKTFKFQNFGANGNFTMYGVDNAALGTSFVFDTIHINCSIPPKTNAGVSSIMNVLWQAHANP